LLLATTKSISMFRQHGRVLGPKGLMPSLKTNTLVEDFATYQPKEEKGARIEQKGEGKTVQGAMVKLLVGKVLF
jgi:ribosomal protein L1